MSAPIIRPANIADIPAIAAIYGEAVRNGTGSFEWEAPTEAEMAQRFHRLQASGHPWLVLEEGGTVAGYAYAGPYHERAGYLHTVQDAIYFRPEARGRGLGRLLLAALIAEAERCGYRQILGIVGDSENTASIRLHLSLGFEQTGIIHNVGWKHGRWLDVVFTQLRLGDGADTPPAG